MFGMLAGTQAGGVQHVLHLTCGGFKAAPHVYLASCRRPLNRRYIVVEGIYANTGLLAPLDKMVPLKHK